jgi:cell wall-associated NlpC family hydrolase
MNQLQTLSMVTLLLLSGGVTAEGTYGVVNVSVADARTEPDFAAGMATQWLMGTALRILEQADWYYVEGPEGYRGWVEARAIVAMPDEDYAQWEAKPKIIITGLYTQAFAEPSLQGQAVSDLVALNRLVYEGNAGAFYRVVYPDGREGFVHKSLAQGDTEWIVSRNPTPEKICVEARRLVGIPYSWGGTSVKAMDCSGFTKTVYGMEGITLFRDASQQIANGKAVDFTSGYGELRPADLLFFGETEDDGTLHIRHVAIYLGDLLFIHASGYIRISSLDPDSPLYDEVNTRELILARRILN